MSQCVCCKIKLPKIASALNLDWKMVRKYVDIIDFNEPDPKPTSEKIFCHKLNPYKPIIDKWLIEDNQAPRKQRHTAKRFFRRFEVEFPEFDCSYRTVASYYSIKHEEIFKDAKRRWKGDNRAI